MKNLCLKLNDEFKDFVTIRGDWNDIFNSDRKGIQYAICFPKVGYGASVIKLPGSYGYENDLWELALLSNCNGTGDWHLAYTELVNDDVLGNLTDNEVNKVLKFISEGRVHEHMEDLYDRVEEESE